MTSLLQKLALCLLGLSLFTGCNSRNGRAAGVGALELPIVKQPLTGASLLETFEGIKVTPAGDRKLGDTDKALLRVFVSQLCGIVAKTVPADVSFPADAEAWNILKANFPTLADAKATSELVKDGKVSMIGLLPALQSIK